MWPADFEGVDPGTPEVSAAERHRTQDCSLTLCLKSGRIKPEGIPDLRGLGEDQSLVDFAGSRPRIGTHPGDVKMLLVER